MVTRIGLAVALALVVVPATLMGSTTYYFIRQNPGYDGSIPQDTAVWRAEIFEVVADSTPSAPDSFVTTDTAEIHALGLQTPSESRLTASAWWLDWYEDFWANRKWGSWLKPGYVYWPNGQKRKTMTAGSATCRITIPGYVAVKCKTYRNSGLYWDPGWKIRPQWYNYSAEWTKSWDYPSNCYWSWRQDGTHSWGSGSYEYSSAYGEW